MKMLLLTGNLYPRPDNNANLLLKLLPFFQKHHEVRILSTVRCGNMNGRNPDYHGVRVYGLQTNLVSPAKRKLLFPAVSKIRDPNGYSDAMNVLYIREELKRIRSEFAYDLIISTSEPFAAAAAASEDSCGWKALYLMDPPELVRNEIGTKYRNQNLRHILNSQTVILTTPFIREALFSSGMRSLEPKIISVGFPMIEQHGTNHSARADRSIRLLFTGWMCSQLRSPQYFLDIVSRLDDRFEVTFMGKECDLLQDRFPTKSKATLITLPNQPYEAALQAMADADVLINIGNSVPIHMPSKTLEYINTGKPMVNFYKFPECPTLYYTKRYPLALNMFEQEKDMDAAAEQFVRFCVENVGKTVEREWIEKEYDDCTPKYIAKMILERLEL